jgi:GntR family transcriptional regulator
MTNYLVAELVPGILSDTGKFVSLYHHLETKYAIKITAAQDKIRAKVADFLESELLQLPPGSPLLVDYRITFSGNKPIEVVEMIVDASKYDFSISLSGRDS